MKKPRRFLVRAESSGESPPVAIYHVTFRVVHRQFLFTPEPKTAAQKAALKLDA